MIINLMRNKSCEVNKLKLKVSDSREINLLQFQLIKVIQVFLPNSMRIHNS